MLSLENKRDGLFVAWGRGDDETCGLHCFQYLRFDDILLTKKKDHYFS